jgi:hypothetical protein
MPVNTVLSFVRPCVRYRFGHKYGVLLLLTVSDISEARVRVQQIASLLDCKL